MADGDTPTCNRLSGCLFSITVAAVSRRIGPSMTLGNMRELLVQRLIASCLNDACGHED